MDLGGVGLLSAKQVYGYVQEASKISQNNYPERMGKPFANTANDRKILSYQRALGIRLGMVDYKALA
jgi:hypothetical protein